MNHSFDLEDFDAYFSMRSMFWMESRERALAEKAKTKAGPGVSPEVDQALKGRVKPEIRSGGTS